nr:FMN-binding protein [uncultured Blautia sp.]
MKNSNFYMRVISVLVILLAVLFYNDSVKQTANETEIAGLTQRIDTLEKQQTELLTALETSYVKRSTAQAAAPASSEDETEGSTETADGDSVDTADNTDTDSSEEDGAFKDGTYTGEGSGYGGTIQVEVTLADQEITNISVVSAPGEDSAYLSQAESVIDSVISAQSTDVDTVSGATFSSTGILNAIDDALGKAENS